MNGRICFSILTVRKYLKHESRSSSFKYFRTVKIEKQIHPFVFGRSYGSTILFRDLLTFSIHFKGLAWEKQFYNWYRDKPKSCEPLSTTLSERAYLLDTWHSALYTYALFPSVLSKINFVDLQCKKYICLLRYQVPMFIHYRLWGW